MSEGKQLGAPQRQWRAASVLFLPLGIGLAPSFLSLGDLPLCAFKHLTGVPCPLCGGIRACAALAQGDPTAALLVNPGLLPLLAVAALHSGLLLAEALAGRQLGPPRALALAWKLSGGFLMLAWLLRALG
jgi:hypothetical protein